MSESLDGLSVAATRQNGGTLLKPSAPFEAGGVNAPAATVCAAVIAASGTRSDERLSHAAGAANAARAASVATIAAATTENFMRRPPGARAECQKSAAAARMRGARACSVWRQPRASIRHTRPAARRDVLSKMSSYGDVRRGLRFAAVPGMVRTRRATEAVLNVGALSIVVAGMAAMNDDVRRHVVNVIAGDRGT